MGIASTCAGSCPSARGKQARLPVRLIPVRVSEEVAEQRRKRLREAARAHGREANAEVLYLAGWTIVVTNVPRARLSIPEALVLLRLRWQIERLFRLWKEHGQIDEWRTRNPWRILCEAYGKLAAMLIQQWLIQDGCPAGPLAQPGQGGSRRAPRSQPHYACLVRRGTATGLKLDHPLYAFGLSPGSAFHPS